MAYRRQAVEAALAGWREAERRLATGEDDAALVQAELVRYRDEYQRLSSNAMTDHIAELQEAEDRRSVAVPSTHPFHRAAQDERKIAAEILEEARSIDEDTPQTRQREVESVS